jgi:hypothetical protein
MQSQRATDVARGPIEAQYRCAGLLSIDQNSKQQGAPIMESEIDKVALLSEVISRSRKVDFATLRNHGDEVPLKWRSAMTIAEGGNDELVFLLFVMSPEIAPGVQRRAITPLG